VKLSVLVVVESGDDTPGIVREVFKLERGALGRDSVGLGLAEAKELLAAVQATMVDEQVNTALAAKVACPHCGTPRRHKGAHTIVVRTLFGTLRLPSPRWHHSPVSHNRPARSARSPLCSPSGSPRSWCTWRPSSPG